MEVNTHPFGSLSILIEMTVPTCKALGSVWLIKPNGAVWIQVEALHDVKCAVLEKNFEHVSCHLCSLGLSPMKRPSFPFLESDLWDVTVKMDTFFML